MSGEEPGVDSEDSGTWFFDTVMVEGVTRDRSSWFQPLHDPVCYVESDPL